MYTYLRLVKAWAPLAFLITVLAALTYVGIQQVYRQSANDPQIQMAEDAAAAVAGGKNLQSLPLTGTVDIARSLSPYLVFYSASGTPVGGNGLLDGKFPILPDGVFTATQASGEDRVTWQPRPDVRQAAIIARIGDGSLGYVMAGRSLREVESRESALEQLVDIAWIIALAGTFGLVALAEHRFKELNG